MNIPAPIVVVAISVALTVLVGTIGYLVNAVVKLVEVVAALVEAKRQYDEEKIPNRVAMIESTLWPREIHGGRSS